MDTIEIYTLVDVTHTRVTRLSQGTELQINQQRNFITLLQCIEIRSIIYHDSPPEVLIGQDLKNFEFGTAYSGNHTVWSFKFTTDRDLVYCDSSGNPIGFLIEDLHEVPIIKKLTETINIDKSIFDCKDIRFKNTVIKVVNTRES